MKLIVLTTLLSTALYIASTSFTAAHPDKSEKRPQTYAEAVIPMSLSKRDRQPKFRHSPGNVRAEDMQALFGNTVIVVNHGRQYNQDRAILKFIFLGRDGRYVWCRLDGEYETFKHAWAPMKVKHDGQLWHRLNTNIQSDNRNGLSPLYDGASGQIVHYRYRGKRWTTWDVGHLQERLPRAVWTLCPDFPSAEELGVGVNEAQTAVTYDKLIAQDPGRRILRPDLITPNPTEVIE